MIAPSLKPRELRILILVGQGLKTAEIAARMGYTDRTMKNYVQLILDELGATNRPHALALALVAGLLSLDDLERQC